VVTRSRSIRVLYLQPAAHFGGAERQAATIVPLLPEQGLETVPLVGPGRAIVEWLEERGVEDYVFTRNFPGGWSPLRGLARAALAPRYARCWWRSRIEIEHLIRAHAIDVVFAAMAFSWVVATPVARRLGVPIVWRAGGTECSPATRRILGTWAQRHRPDLLVCNGDAVRRLYAPLIGAPAITVRNGIAHDQFHPGAGDRSAFRPPGARVVIGFAARLVPQKRPEDFIAAAARFAAHDDVTFLLAGEGSRRPYYEEMARQAGAHNVQVLGYVRDMRDFYAACDVLVLPSRSEGCPNVVLEAMAMKTAVVAADNPATRELVTSGVDGLLYPIGDVDALEAALAKLIARPPWLRLLVERGYRRASQLTARECARRTAMALRSVVAEAPSVRVPATPERTALRS
jgi:glycosyltransferase involved in cell wall biosynthesis